MEEVSRLRKLLYFFVKVVSYCGEGVHLKCSSMRSQNIRKHIGRMFADAIAQVQSHWNCRDSVVSSI